MRALDRASGAVLVLLGLFAAWQAFAIGLGRAEEPGGGLMPLVVAVGLGVTGLAILVTAGRHDEAAPWPAPARRGSMLRFVTATVLYFAVVAWAGFLLSTTAFLAYLLRAHGRYPWWLVVLLTALVAGGLYAVFELWLRNPLPAGIWRDLR